MPNGIIQIFARLGVVWDNGPRSNLNLVHFKWSTFAYYCSNYAIAVVPSRTSGNKILYVRHYKAEIGGEDSRTCRQCIWDMEDPCMLYNVGCQRPNPRLVLFKCDVTSGPWDKDSPRCHLCLRVTSHPAAKRRCLLLTITPNTLTVKPIENIPFSVYSLNTFVKHLFSQMCHKASLIKHLCVQNRLMFAVHISRYF